MDNLRPHDGKRTKAAEIDLNVKGYKPGDFVLFESLFGARVGFIDQVIDNSVTIGPLVLDVRKVVGRVPDDVDTVPLLARLQQAEKALSDAGRAAQDDYERVRSRILREYRVK